MSRFAGPIKLAGKVVGGANTLSKALIKRLGGHSLMSIGSNLIPGSTTTYKKEDK